MSESDPPSRAIADLPIPLARGPILRSLIRELSGALHDVVALEEASGLISVVGQQIGGEHCGGGE